MREHPPILVGMQAAHALCLLTKHQLIDLLVSEMRSQGHKTDLDVLKQIETRAKKLLPTRKERCPKIVAKLGVVMKGHDQKARESAIKDRKPFRPRKGEVLISQMPVSSAVDRSFLKVFGENQ